MGSCHDWVLVERSEKLASHTKSVAKIICIDPRFFYDDDESNYYLKKVNGITADLRSNIEKYSRQNGLSLDIRELDANASAGYYEELLKLKKNMIAVNFNQRTPFNFNNRSDENTIRKKVFVYPPRIAYEFNTYSKTYSTPYFSYVGLYKVKGNLVLYHLVVDTDECETIYREVKVVKSGMDPVLISQMVHDSYAMLAREFTKSKSR
jgi:hypothetical protein